MSHDQTQLDVGYVRGHFPGLGEWAFFENAGGTLVPHSVIERVNAYMRETQVQPGASYAASAHATGRIDEAHRRMAAMINAGTDEIIIGPSTTMNVYVLSHALRPWFQPGDELIVTDLDHEANNGAWRRLAELGVEVKEWRLNPESAELEVEDLDALLTERTRLVCFTHCSNITGSLHDVRAIARRVHDAGALVCVDGVAYAPHRSIDVKALDVDFYALSLYKLYGPHLGLLYGKREHLVRARGQNHFFIGEDQIPLKLVPGGVNHELTASLAGISDYFDALHAHHFPGSNADLHTRVDQVFELVARHEATLGRRFLDFLIAKPQVCIVGRATSEPARRVPTFSFVVRDRDSEELPPHMEPHKIAVRAGHFYAARCIRALGLEPQHGVVRASMVHYNTPDEVDRLIQHLDEVL
ncbi:MAG: cysteine desulfurase-like protein [Gammaproteobacteria bacterium]|nr:cysteine desulfurase-like protein [Gammaproteobacteria bacterium]NIR82578.1 cysteine desulfurase-like protein [Gammaproteobacteria bacterium]NIR88781.1 cysteine desulfurase-like protein [Gammaproteobacteria bacterium]NIV73986.1 cysteine desulfurase-like protein [Gammaproteobacteria bacterium]